MAKKGPNPEVQKNLAILRVNWENGDVDNLPIKNRLELLKTGTAHDAEIRVPKGIGKDGVRDWHNWVVVNLRDKPGILIVHPSKEGVTSVVSADGKRIFSVGKSVGKEYTQHDIWLKRKGTRYISNSSICLGVQ